MSSGRTGASKTNSIIKPFSFPLKETFVKKFDPKHI